MSKKFENWKNKGQPAEFNHHKSPQSHNFRGKDEVFEKSNTELLKSFYCDRDDFIGKKIIDLGAGSRLRTKWFNESYIIAIEPLADKFKSISFCDLDDADEVYSEPAEKFLENLEEQVDAIICINVLDHCYDAEIIMENCYKYLKDGGKMLLSVDLNSKEDYKHPINFSVETLQKLVRKVGFNIEREYDIRKIYTSDPCSTVVLVKNLEQENNN